MRKQIFERRSQSPQRKPPKNIENILSKISLYEMFPHIFAVVIKDDRLRARVFMRYQEFYESDSENFRGKGFKWVDFVNYYKQKTKSDILTYHKDWAGYNIPCNSIESCMRMIPDINFYDLIMFSIVDTIRKSVGSDDFYLIGIDQANGENPDLINHEMAHGLWFADKKYRAEQKKNLMDMDENTKESLGSKIKKMGYGENVVEDEIQAYLSTGTDTSMNVVKNIKKAQIPFRETFDKFSDKFRARKIPIDWTTDLNA